MGFCSCTSKFVIVVINIVFLIGAALMIFAGVSYLQSSDGVMDSVHNKPAYITFGIAAVLCLCGVIGIAAAFSEKKVLLGIFIVVIVANLVLLVFVSASLFVKEDSAMNETEKFVWKQFDHYGSPNLTVMLNTEPEEYGSGNGTTTTAAPTPSPPVITTTAAPTPQTNSTDFIDKIQENLECCGYDNYTDWNEFTYWTETMSMKNKVPYSCCNDTAAKAMNKTCPDSGHLSMKKSRLIYTKGCKKEINTVVMFVYKFMEWTAVVFAIVVFLGFLATVFLMCRKRNSDGINYSSIVA